MEKSQLPIHPILIVDDEERALQGLEAALNVMGFSNIICCKDSQKVSEILKNQKIEILLLDLIMPHISGEEILNQVTHEYPEIPVIILTGVNDVHMAVKCIRKGAFDYLLKPLDQKRLGISIRMAYDLSSLRRENTNLAKRFFSDELENPEVFKSILTASRTMISVFQYCEAIKESSQPVLITGETGVGKELIAKSLHHLSRRKGKFVAVDIAGLDDHMINDTLFGHLKGAFTGANNARQGLIDNAKGGTLFLDEIGDLSHASQVKLLRVIQEREYCPLGSDIAKPSDVRILVATHRNLAERLKTGDFRKDLYYRLKTHHVHLPPLRERREDIPLLLDYFLEVASNDLGKKNPKYPPELLTLLGTYSFPGNIRELQSMVFDAISHHKGKVLSTEMFKKSISSDRTECSANQVIANFQNKQSWMSMLPDLPTLKETSTLLVLEAMRRTGNNQRIAAHLLGISPQAFNKRWLRLSNEGMKPETE